MAAPTRTRIKPSADERARGARLRLARESRGWTQIQLGSQSEYDPTSISRAERGLVPIEGKFLRALLRALNVSTEWLVSGQGAAPTPSTPTAPILPSEPDHGDDYPERAKVRELAIYREYPERVRQIFEGLNYDHGDEISVKRWNKLLTDLDARFSAWLADGKAPDKFRFVDRDRDRPTEFRPRESKLPKR